MFMRNLEILSGMKWTLCGLLLIPAIFCISAEDCSKVCERSPNHKICNNNNALGLWLWLANTFSTQFLVSNNGKDAEKVIFILGTDGFMGYMRTGDSNKTR